MNFMLSLLYLLLLLVVMAYTVIMVFVVLGREHYGDILEDVLGDDDTDPVTYRTHRS